MGLEVIWSNFADNVLSKIFSYYKITVSTSVAKRITIGIVEETIRLSSHPYIGQTEPLLEDYPEDFRYDIYKHYTIIYLVNPDQNQIEIIHVFDVRQNPEKIKQFLTR